MPDNCTPDNWVHTRRPSPLGHGVLIITHPRDRPEWPTLALAYRAGTLPGLTTGDSAHTSRVQSLALPGHKGLFFFKRHLNRHRLDGIKNLFRHSRARRAWLADILGRPLGLHTPPTVCVIEERRWGRLTFDAIVTEAVPSAPPLREWLTTLRGSDRRSLLRALAAEVDQLHRHGVHHGDMRIRNILCARTESGFAFTWLDNDRTRIARSLSFRARVNNLVQLNYEPQRLSLTDRMRFWKEYSTGLPPAFAARLRDQVIRRTRHRWRKRGWTSGRPTFDDLRPTEKTTTRPA